MTSPFLPLGVGLRLGAFFRGPSSKRFVPDGNPQLRGAPEFLSCRASQAMEEDGLMGLIM